MGNRADWIFRCDGNALIGAGHVMRCLSIAEVAKKQGQHCFFVVADGNFSETITSRGHEVFVLHSDYRQVEQELNSFLSVINRCTPRILLVDSYFAKDSYLNILWETMQGLHGSLVYIDDILEFAYPCDVLLNYNIYGPDREKDYKEFYKNAGRRFPEFLLGTSYVPLRGEFRDLPVREVHKQAENIFISTGGSDPEHVGMRLIETILQRNGELQRFHFHFLVGIMNEDGDKMRRLAESVENITLYFHVSRICQLMSKMDIAISAAGSTLYELCVTQTPTLTYVFADNQIQGAEGFERYGVMHNTGDVRDCGTLELAGKILDEMLALAADYERRMAVALKMRNMVDGRGAERVVEALF